MMLGPNSPQQSQLSSHGEKSDVVLLVGDVIQLVKRVAKYQE